MIPSQFKYVSAQSIEEAISMLQEANGEGKILAGGHSLVPLLKFRITTPGTLVDITRIPGLKEVRVEDGRLIVGALKTHFEISRNETIIENIPSLAKTASETGDLQVRNYGTIGGNIVHGDPVADYPAIALALDAELKVEGEDGTEMMPVDGFALGPLITMMPENALVTEVSFEIPPEHVAQTYLKYTHPATGYPLVGVAAIAGTDSGGAIDYIRIGITGVSDVSYRARPVEEHLMGKKPSKALIEEAAALATEGAEMGSDLFASPEYRAHITNVYVRRALHEVLK
ncbi:FAD binding domain-containing protein [Lacicoccus alkaliphilus]|uniref:Carbon-monoxide dehydrogenase medium subunit n=1 Tax=Lacicoccus alkaliphilus DSM 16010 TaxID=1123231 RepID=A0A1M7H4P9_9BACL|nr:xanthine dehydrogenase family protein subunit M [Salinicoccus alkaliphilus]SHM22937.1 carbon-monoxide dehydrogenase medium subunit [Salinicoccus alkaliphilus DSM 16010]